MKIPFIGGSYMLRNVVAEAQRCVNLYAEIDETREGKSVGQLVGTPGLVAVTTGLNGPVRADYSPSSGERIVVAGRKAYRMAGDAAIEIGSLNTQSGYVDVADDGTTAVIVDGPFGYFVTLADNTFAQITSDAFYGSDSVAYIDGYFLFNNPGTGQFYIATGTTFDALDFATAEGAPDPVIGLIELQRELWLFGRDSIEVWFNSGDVDFPFQRIGGGYIEHGCASAGSIVRLDNSVFWLGRDTYGGAIVWRGAGYTPQRVSTFAIEQEFAGYVTSDAVAYGYQQDGHPFYVLSFPSEDRTWVYDASSGLWHERAWRDPSGILHRHRSNCHNYDGSIHRVGDWETGTIYRLDTSEATDNGALITRIRSTPHISNELKRTRMDTLQIDMATGVSPQGQDCKALLDWSDDGGRTYVQTLTASIGPVGGYKTRLLWRRLGMSRDRVYRLNITANCTVSLVSAIAVTQRLAH